MDVQGVCFRLFSGDFLGMYKTLIDPDDPSVFLIKTQGLEGKQYNLALRVCLS